MTSDRLNNLPENRQRLNLLFDFYGALLTERQREIFSLYHHDDCSLAEIGEAEGITPQAAQDMLKRVAGRLDRYEAKLGLVQKHRVNRQVIGRIRQLVDELNKGANSGETTARIVEFLDLLG